MKKVLTMLLVVCLLIASVMPVALAEGEKTKLRVAGMSFYCSNLIQMMQDTGWADEMGLELEYSVFSNGMTINEAMGEWDVAVTGGAFIYALANYDCKLVGHQIDGSGDANICSRKGSEYEEAWLAGDKERLAELVRGSDILTNVGITGHYAVMLWLNSLGLTGDDVNFINQEMATIYASWTAGEGDLALLTFPYDTMVDENTVKMETLQSVGGSMLEALVCTKDVYENNYDALVKFVQLCYRCCDALAADPELALENDLKWYRDNGKDLDEESALGELNAKPYITSKEAKAMDLTQFPAGYGAYLATQGLVEEDRLEVIVANCANDVLQAALAG